MQHYAQYTMDVGSYQSKFLLIVHRIRGSFATVDGLSQSQTTSSKKSKLIKLSNIGRQKVSLQLCRWDFQFHVSFSFQYSAVCLISRLLVLFHVHYYSCCTPSEYFHDKKKGNYVDSTLFPTTVMQRELLNERKSF